MDELNRLQGIAHEYRKSVDAYERRTGRPGQTVDNLGSGEEREKFAKMDADLDAVERTIQAQYAMRKAAEDRVRELEARLAEPTLRAKLPAISGVEDRDSKEYAQRWMSAVLSGNPMEMRALSTSSSNAAIPTDMERRIVQKLQQANVLRQLARVTTIDSKRTISVEGNLPTTALVGEGSSISASDPSFATAISVTPYKFATRVTMSQEFIEDAIGTGGIGSGLDYVADKCGLSIALKQEEYYTIGTGSSEPQGIADESGGITQLETIGAGGAGNAPDDDLTGDMIINCVHRVSPQYRSGPRFSWLMHDSMIKAIRKLKVNTTDYIWKPSENGGLTEGIPGTIYGIPYRISAYMKQSDETTNTAFVAVVGNFDYFEIFDRTGITSMIDPYSAAATHQVNLYVYTRTDSKIMLPAAFAAITV